jgi:poly(3-hydroxybutyrate) depolymerase
MKLEFLTYPELGRSMYVLYPAGDRLSCYENTLITVLREDDSDDLPKSLLADADFCALSDAQRFLLLFPNPIGKHWNWELDPAGRDDLGDVAELVRLFNHQEGFVDCGIYHNMHKRAILLGSGTGGSLLHALAAINPVNVAGVYTSAAGSPAR